MAGIRAKRKERITGWGNSQFWGLGASKTARKSAIYQRTRRGSDKRKVLKQEKGVEKEKDGRGEDTERGEGSQPRKKGTRDRCQQEQAKRRGKLTDRTTGLFPTSK